MGIFDEPSKGGAIGDAMTRIINNQEEPSGFESGATPAQRRNQANGQDAKTGHHKEDGSFDEVGFITSNW